MEKRGYTAEIEKRAVLWKRKSGGYPERKRKSGKVEKEGESQRNEKERKHIKIYGKQVCTSRD